MEGKVIIARLSFLMERLGFFLAGVVLLAFFWLAPLLILNARRPLSFSDAFIIWLMLIGVCWAATFTPPDKLEERVSHFKTPFD